MIPAVVLTGGLGSGKTTLLNRILGHRHDLRIAVIENELGDVGVDAALLTGAQDVLEVTGGCACCTLRGQLAIALAHVAERAVQFDAVIVEASGAADPVPLVQALHAFDVSHAIRLSALACVTDLSALVGADRIEHLAARQLRYADTVILTKADRTTADSARSAIGLVRAHARQDAVLVDTADALPRIGTHLQTLPPALTHPAAGAPDSDTEQLSTVALDADLPLDPAALQRWLDGLLGDPQILRVKGQVLLEGRRAHTVVQLAHHQLELHPSALRRTGRLVVIGHDLQRPVLQQALDACRSAATTRR